MSEVKVNKISPRTNCGTVTVGDAGDSVTVTAGVPVTVNGDLKSNALKAIDGGSIISQCGTTITLGASGDTINLAAGASQTGFGRTGTVDWDTTAKTADFTAVSGNGYFVNTTSGAVTVTLPASPSAGDIVAISDYASTSASNNIIVDRNSSPINGANANYTISVAGLAVTLVYVDATRGWKSVNGSDQDATGIDLNFINATGGTITTCGDYKIHTFTGPGTFCVSNVAPGPSGNPNAGDYLVVAGGGGGGNNGGGGGGAGGFRASAGTGTGCYTVSPLASPVSPITLTATSYPITVGAGGPGPTDTGPGVSNGSSSSGFSITSAGGGGGGHGGTPQNGSYGGSGGGAHRNGTGGSGNTPSVSPPQGTNGNNGDGAGGSNGGGGGGGASGGNPGSNGTGGTGGDGSFTNINPTGGTTGPVCGQRYYAGGGGGGGACQPGSPAGGVGGGGAGTNTAPATATNGTANTGGGGGGGGGAAGGGGSGIVIIRYKYQ